jgi:hypothetical protein
MRWKRWCSERDLGCFATARELRLFIIRLRRSGSDNHCRVDSVRHESVALHKCAIAGCAPEENLLFLDQA